MYRYSVVVFMVITGLLPAMAADKPAASAIEGFHMTGMLRDTVQKETEAMQFKGMRRETPTRVLKETTNKKN